MLIKKVHREDDEIKAFLGKGSEFNGKLIFNGIVRIDGDFVGEIFGNGSLVVGEGAHVRADIEVDSLLASGEITGRLNVRQRMSIFATGRVVGNLRAPVFVMEEGALFEGTSAMIPADNAADASETALPASPVPR